MAGLLGAPGQARADSRYQACEVELSLSEIHETLEGPDPIQLQTIAPGDLDDLTIEAAPGDGWRPLCVSQRGKDDTLLEQTRADNSAHGFLVQIQYSKTGYDLRRVLADNRAEALKNAAKPSAKDCPATDIVADSVAEGDRSQSWYFRARHYLSRSNGACEAVEEFARTIVVDTSRRSYLVSLRAFEIYEGTATGPGLLDEIGDQMRDGVAARAD